MTDRPRGLRTPTQGKPILAGFFAAALLGGYQAPAAQEVWIGGQSPLWSSAESWLDGSAPAVGGSSTLELVFHKGASVAGTASINDLPDAFNLNRLTLDSNSASLLSIERSAGSYLRFAGIDRTIEMKGVGDVTIRSAIGLDIPSGIVTIRNTGLGKLTLQGPIGGTQTLVIEGDSSRTLPFVSLAGTNTSSGGAVLKSGNLSILNDAAFGTGQLLVEGGTLRVGTFSRAIKLNGNLTIDSPSGTLNSVISELSPGRGITVRNGLTMTAASTFSGVTNIEASLSMDNVASTPTLILSGSGSLLNTSAVNVRGGSTLRIEGVNTGASNRIADSTPINLQGGTLHFLGVSGSVAQTETVGPVSAAGYSTISVTNGSAALEQITASSLARVDRGTMLLRGTQLGAGTKIVFSTAPTGLVGGGGTGANTSILPWAIGDVSSSSDGSTLVTYNASAGVRPLSLTTDYIATLSSGTATNNFNLSTSQSLSAPRTINALVLSGGSIQGSEALTITSGTILQRSGAGLHVPLNFGASEANIFTVGDLQITGAISGSNGLTKSSSGTLTLMGANTFTGPLTINAGLVSFSNMQNLGADSSTIVLAGAGAGLSYAGQSNLIFNRAIETKIGIGRLDLGGTGDLTLGAPISGAGGMRFSAAPGRTLTLSGSSTYSGPTQVTSGQVVIDNDTAFGNGGDLHLSDSTLKLVGSWTSSRTISTKNAIIDTGGFDATLSGVAVGTELTKSGIGTLRLNAPSTVGTMRIEQGALELGGNSVLRSTFLSVSTGGELRLDNSSTILDRISDDTILSLDGGSLVISGNASSAVSETIGELSAGGLVRLGAAGNQSVSLHLNFSSMWSAVISADNLGGSASEVFQRLTVKGLSTSTGIFGGVYSAPGSSEIANSLVLYDGGSDAAGVIGFRALRSSEYSTGPQISNPANGGDTASNANFLATGTVTTNGTANTIQSLTLDAGSTLTLGAGHNLEISSGQILSRGGGNKVVVSQGSLSFAHGRAEIYAAGDLEISSAIQGYAPLKTGPGTLTLQPGSVAYSGDAQVFDGVLQVGSPLLLQEKGISVQGRGTFTTGAGNASLGSVSGDGTLNVAGGTLTLGTLGTDFYFYGKISGTGQVVITDGGNPAALRQLNGSSSLAGTIELQSGRLSLGSNNALGSSTLVVSGGSLEASLPVTISPNIQLQSDLRIGGFVPITLGPGTSISGSHDVQVQSSTALKIESVLNLGGKLVVRPENQGAFAITAGDIVIQGPSGGVASATGISIEEGGTLTLSYANGYQGAANARLGDAIPVNLRSGNFELVAGSTSSAVETIGVLSVGGQSNVRLTPTGTTDVILTAASLDRNSRGQVQFLSSVSPLDGTRARILLGTAPALVGGGGTGAATSIIPWAIGTDNSSRSFVTYGLNGIRSLTNSEYVAIGAAGPTLNVSVDSNATNDGTLSMNAPGFTLLPSAEPEHSRFSVDPCFNPPQRRPSPTICILALPKRTFIFRPIQHWRYRE